MTSFGGKEAAFIWLWGGGGASEEERAGCTASPGTLRTVGLFAGTTWGTTAKFLDGWVGKIAGTAGTTVVLIGAKGKKKEAGVCYKELAGGGEIFRVGTARVIAAFESIFVSAALGWYVWWEIGTGPFPTKFPDYFTVIIGAVMIVEGCEIDSVFCTICNVLTLYGFYTTFF